LFRVVVGTPRDLSKPPRIGRSTTSTRQTDDRLA
jgi:hypothetical protein